MNHYVSVLPVNSYWYESEGFIQDQILAFYDRFKDHHRNAYVLGNNIPTTWKRYQVENLLSWNAV